VTRAHFEGFFHLQSLQLNATGMYFKDVIPCHYVLGPQLRNIIETSGTNYPLARHHISEERVYQLHRCENLKRSQQIMSLLLLLLLLTTIELLLLLLEAWGSVVFKALRY
jgi:hypothetical protein